MADVQTETAPASEGAGWADAIGAAFDQLEKADEAAPQSADHAGNAGEVGGSGDAADSDAELDADDRVVDPEASEGAREGESAAPEHWSAADKELLDSLPEDRREAVLAWRKSIEGDATRKTQDAARATKALERFESLYKPFMRGGVEMTPDHMVAATEHLVGWQRKLANEPENSLVQLVAEMRQGGRFAGSDQAQLINRLSEALGVSAGARAPEQAGDDEYLDPSAARELRSQRQQIADLTRELQELRGSFKQTAEAAESKATADLQRHIVEFKDAKGEDGKPLRPYFDELRDDMAALNKATGETDLSKLYDKALWANATTREKELRRRDNAAQLARSVKRSEAAKKASAASSPRSESVGTVRDGTSGRKFRTREEELGSVFDSLAGAA